MIDELLPSPVGTGSTFVDYDAALTALYPQEVAAVASARPKRRQEYANVRMCARRAMGELGVPPAPVLSGGRGEPLWPDGIVGSMTHCPGFRAAAMARSSAFLGLGIDAEPNLPLAEDLLEFIALPQERARVEALMRSSPGVCWDRLLFSAKEAVFKVWFPLAERGLDFTQADIRIDPGSGTFSARLLVPGPTADGGRVEGFDGRWLSRQGILLTAIALRRTTGR
ncbi:MULTISPECIES: 4'-phosphopantetheinyl transferase superfamily protein [unclassified Streptomyces]|uniref:4'-phosphopantetheinyl transferase family protein n=1 Tax=unclassified Streptomyces TaxID=2593676 RepID=UPI001BE5DC28|nr:MULTISPECIES: 4'-phosphopantetheinyl transferase superfamily protein [unclassified Streptomyces]MBT2404448.1 4'-phosphopantetheinyl transferase superfamily protein [Streptomyces sp. ISL-21]MBT2612498.1 4'-phosphopantetheinyl transferase superfamily protein [Streptomyces sp. ISL-87]